MKSRSYVSPIRDAAAAEKRARVIEMAGRLLRGKAGISSFSLDAVAKAAGVTRLTVYKQFGSRRGLLEAVFDDRARQGGLGRIAEAMAMADPRDFEGPGALPGLFCMGAISSPLLAENRRHALARQPNFQVTPPPISISNRPSETRCPKDKHLVPPEAPGPVACTSIADRLRLRRLCFAASNLADHPAFRASVEEPSCEAGKFGVVTGVFARMPFVADRSRSDQIACEVVGALSRLGLP
jgi:AcrR family transcriptional regulator